MLNYYRRLLRPVWTGWDRHKATNWIWSRRKGRRKCPRHRLRRPDHCEFIIWWVNIYRLVLSSWDCAILGANWLNYSYRIGLTCFLIGCNSAGLKNTTFAHSILIAQCRNRPRERKPFQSSRKNGRYGQRNLSWKGLFKIIELRLPTDESTNH